MTIRLDNHLSPALARWIESALGIPCAAIRDLGMARASDLEIFSAAKASARVLITKDRDFAELTDRLGPPPAVILPGHGQYLDSASRGYSQDRFAHST